MNSKNKFIVIEGNIGAGKTSLVNMFAKKYNAKIILEQFAENPFLPKFYKNPEHYSFPVEVSFLVDRFNQLSSELGKNIENSQLIISDYYFKKSLIFAATTLKADEFILYKKLFNIIIEKIQEPDLFVFLYKSTNNLLKQIKQRGRDYEQSIDEKYLADLQDKYFAFFKQQPKLKILVIDTNNIDFVNNKADFVLINNAIFNQEYDFGINTITIP